jgi:hypothetical protein
MSGLAPAARSFHNASTSSAVSQATRNETDGVEGEQRTGADGLERLADQLERHEVGVARRGVTNRGDVSDLGVREGRCVELGRFDAPLTRRFDPDTAAVAVRPSDNDVPSPIPTRRHATLSKEPGQVGRRPTSAGLTMLVAVSLATLGRHLPDITTGGRCTVVTLLEARVDPERAQDLPPRVSSYTTSPLPLSTPPVPG